ncbi:MAG: ABC transporter ATP-binding protein [Planctomycetota bacterium]|nr:MAG: ABC transporter ATP-binding protein [Planctomycetota bacterium]
MTAPETSDESARSDAPPGDLAGAPENASARPEPEAAAGEPASDAILTASELYKFFGSGASRFPVVREASLEVGRGRFVTVMGPSGSGKSTLLHMVSGLEPPSGGTVHLDGHDLWALSEKRRTLLRRDTVGFVFQFFNLVPNLTVAENIRLPLLIGAAVAEGGEGDFDELVSTFELGDKLKNYPHQLSGGEMQRSSIARALIARPAVIMADEPTGNISSKAGEEVMRLFRRCCDERGQTIMLVTHNPRDASFADEVHFLKDGELHPEQQLGQGQVTAQSVNASLAVLGI